jgi:lipopolysaccharide transport system ATP-binding protein
MDTVISVENLSKIYRLGQIGTGTFANDMQVWWAKLRGKPNPLLKIGMQDYANREGEDLWALRDVSFTVEQGEVLGIIGRNGAGKSTLLKILSRVTAPTSGKIKIKGRVASLLEVGTGFHPDLTGRENIYLNGVILGMKRDEITRKFDEIVDFSEVEKFIDTPVKRYSSGMYVRLAFAVAAHLDPEILAVDEVLAVGDAEFQKKCLGKMGNVAQGGRTVLFVSHNMGAMSRLCKRGILLHQGYLSSTGEMGELIDQYLQQSMDTKQSEVFYKVDLEKTAQILSVKLLNSEKNATTQLDRMKPFQFQIDYVIRKDITGAYIAVMLDKTDGTRVIASSDQSEMKIESIDRSPGYYRTNVEYPGCVINSGSYQFRIGITRLGGKVYDYQEPIKFSLEDIGSFSLINIQRPHTGVLAIPLTWQTIKLDTYSTMGNNPKHIIAKIP